MNSFSFDELERQSPKGIIVNYGLLLYKLVKSLWVIIILILTRDSGERLPYFLFGLGGLAVVLFVIAVVQYLYFKFKIEGDHFLLNKGMVFKKKISIPIERIQSVNFKQNIIHQIINVTQVEIQTAGAKDVEVSIKAISRQKAEALKNRLESFKSIDATKSETEIPVIARDKLIYKLSFLELLKVSFSENHIKSFFGIIAIVISLGYQMQDVVKDWSFSDELVKFVVRNKAELKGSLVVVSLLIVLGLVVSIIVSIVRVFLVHFEQNVIQRNDGIQVSEGLFTRREDVLKIKKIQYTITITNPIKRKLGIQTIRIKQAGSAKTKSKKMVQLIGVKNEFLEQLNLIFFNYIKSENVERFKPARYYLFRLFMRTFVLLLVINVFFFLNQFSLTNWLLADLLILPFSILLVILKYKKTYFHFKDNMLIVGGGKIGTVTTTLEYFKTQNIKYKQSFIQKRRGVATLRLQTASGVVKLACLHKADARMIQQRITSEVQNTTRDWI